MYYPPPPYYEPPRRRNNILNTIVDIGAIAALGLFLFVFRQPIMSALFGAPPVTVVQPVATQPPALPPAPPQPQIPPVVVAPQPAEQAPAIELHGMPDLPRPIPTAEPPTPVVTPFPAAMYAAPTPVLNGPAEGPAECNSQNAPYKGEKDVVLNGVPLGHIAAWSCESTAAVAADLQAREVAMVEAAQP